MKKLILSLMAILFLGVTGLATAQTGPAKTPRAVTHSNAKNPNAHALHKRVKQQMRQIQVDLKAGKITQAQAKAKRDNLMALHKQIREMRNLNGGRDLSDDQAKQFNASLDKN